MNRKILLIEPNYQNKFPPIALMKLSTYHKSLGDEVVFYKGDIKSFIINRIADKCVDSLKSVEPDFYWQSKRDVIINYIRTRKSEFLEALVEDHNDTELLVRNWLCYYKDYYWKKTYLQYPEWDRIFVTTLFTFYYDITVKTINEVKVLIKPNGMVHVGGILASLQPEEIEAATGIKPHIGLLNKPGDLDEGDTQIIDELPLDYTILEEIDYKYDMANAYYGYLTRGCIRHCAFCAVPKLEPTYNDFIPLKERIARVDELCGPQKDLLLMDNNVLASHSFDQIIEEIIDCGFGAGATYMPADYLEIATRNLRNGINDRGYTRKTQRLLIEYYRSIKDKRIAFEVFSILDNHHVLKIETSTKEELLAAYKEVEPYYKKSRQAFSRPRARLVDFNQGVDARLFTPHIAKQLSRIAISPLRIAFDHLSLKDEYVRALTMCREQGIKNFSNYLLYNFNDKPVELYKRMEINVLLCDELQANIYSFPMKYHPLFGEHSHDRDYIGKYWNKKYIRAVQAVLNSTKGMIGRGTSYFYKAFGNNEDEYLTLLEMPDTFIIYRFFFEWLSTKQHPYSIQGWVDAMNTLSDEEREFVYSIIHAPNFSQWNKSEHPYSESVNYALRYYANLRDDVQDKDGVLYELKCEFDALPKEAIEDLKTSHLPIIKH